MPTQKQIDHLKSLNAYRAAKGRGLFHYDDAGKLVDSEKTKPDRITAALGKLPPMAPAPSPDPVTTSRWDEWRRSPEGRRTIDTPLPAAGPRAWGELEARLKIAFLAGTVEEVDV